MDGRHDVLRRVTQGAVMVQWPSLTRKPSQKARMRASRKTSDSLKPSAQTRSSRRASAPASSVSDRPAVSLFDRTLPIKPSTRVTKAPQTLAPYPASGYLSGIPLSWTVRLDFVPELMQAVDPENFKTFYPLLWLADKNQYCRNDNENFGRVDWVARYNNLVDRMREKMRRELGVVEYVEADERSADSPNGRVEADRANELREVQQLDRRKTPA